MRENAGDGDPMSETPLALVREALTAKLAADLGRAHRATHAAEQVSRLAAQLVEELAGARVREEQRQAHEEGHDLELEDLLELRYPPPDVDVEGDNDQPAGPT